MSDSLPRAARAMPAPPMDSASGERWASVIEQIRPNLTILDLYGVEDAVAVGGTAEELTLSVGDDIALRAVKRLVPKIESALQEIEGTEVMVRVRSHLPGSAIAVEPAANDNEVSE